jgi:hypothetical protein
MCKGIIQEPVSREIIEKRCKYAQELGENHSGLPILAGKRKRFEEALPYLPKRVFVAP